MPILLAVTIIGLVTFVLSYCGIFVGKRFGHFFESKVEIVGGLILITIGIKIVIEHLTA
jgi:putative Mn2+ efflux pump MntP